jgi:excisionase family DNA binding protein
MLTIKEVAARLRLSLSKTYVLLNSGKLGYYQFDGAKRVSEEQLAAYLDATKREQQVVPPERTSPRTRLRHLKL